jgi:hypothetical protein
MLQLRNIYLGLAQVGGESVNLELFF